MKKVFFDESGYTGPNLLDPERPFFALASVHFDLDQEAESFACFAEVKAEELKFTNLRKYPKSQRAVRRFLESDIVSTLTVAGYVIHQPYMVVAKYCDLVLEPSMRARGIDFYERGMNIAVTNLLSMTMPLFAGKENWSRFLTLFATFVKNRQLKDFLEWRRHAVLLHSVVEDKDAYAANYLAPVLALKRNGAPLIGTLRPNEFCPMLPAFTVLLNHWGKQLEGRFVAVSDDSNALSADKELLNEICDPDQPSFVAGQDRRTMRFPLPMSTLEFADSKKQRQIQLADVVAGALATGLKAKHTGVNTGFEYDMLQITAGKGLVIDGMWPSTDITPEELGTC